MTTNQRVLLVDDMGGIRRAVGHLLRQAGFEVVEVEDGAEAIDKLDQADYSLVITDIIMPKKDGGEVISWMKDHNKEARIIAMSGGGAHSTADQALRQARAEADAVLMKPFARNELMMTVSRVLEAA